VRVSYSNQPEKPFAIIEIRPAENFDFIIIAAIAPLTRVSSPGGGVHDPAFPARSENYIFHAPTQSEFDTFNMNMLEKYPDWYRVYVEEDNRGIFCETDEDDPSDRGIKTPVRRINRDALDRLFKPINAEEERKHELAAASSLSPERDIDRKGSRAS
jgi:hypothetical protein